MRESGEMEDTESRREENERRRGGETGMYHLVLNNRGSLFCYHILGYRAFLMKNILNPVSFCGYTEGYFKIANLSVGLFQHLSIHVANRIM